MQKSSTSLSFAELTRRQAALAGGVVTVLSILFFFLLFWNRFLGLRSGDGGFSSGVFFLRGFLPYRDYYCVVPPLFIARCSALLAVFGHTPVVLHAAGVVERLLLGALVYAWLLRLFRAKDAALASIVTVVVSSADYADPVSSYNHFCILLAVASGFAASFALEAQRTRRMLAVIGGVTGLLAFLCMATKQTIGIAIGFSVPLLAGLWLVRAGGVRRAASFLLGFAAGWGSFALLFVAWMSRYQLLQAFLYQAFVVGPKAKASSPGDFWTHTVIVASRYWWELLLACGLIALAWPLLQQSAEEQDSDSEGARGIEIAGVLLLSAAAIGAGALHRFGLSLSFVVASKPPIYVAFLGTAVLIPWYFAKYLKRRLTGREIQLALFAVVSFVCALATSLSYPAFEAMCVPGMALFVAAFLNDRRPAVRWAVYGVCASLLFCVVQAKLDAPFGFNHWSEPPTSEAQLTSTLPELAGLQLPENTVSFVDNAVRLIRANSTPEDTIFIYPDLSILYGLADRRPATFSFSHNIDVASDAFLRSEAERLLRERPAVVLCAVVSEKEQAVDESFWRNGRTSGQRELIAATQQLIGQYRMEAEFTLYPYGRKAYLFVRP